MRLIDMLSGDDVYYIIGTQQSDLRVLRQCGHFCEPGFGRPAQCCVCAQDRSRHRYPCRVCAVDDP